MYQPSDSTYFSELETLANDTAQKLAAHDARAELRRKDMREDRMQGMVTEKAEREASKQLDAERQAILDAANASADELEKRQAEGADEITMPRPGTMDLSLIDVLKNFNLTSREFDKLVAENQRRPVSLRLLAQYKDSHPEIQSTFKFQDADARKKNFQTARNTVMGIATGNFDIAKKAEHVKYFCAKHYHSIQGALEDRLPVPEVPEELRKGQTSTLF